MQRPPARERLLRAADRLLFDRGIRATPVDELLREADVAAATLYAHFGTKDGLVAAALEARADAWRRVWDRHIVEAADDAERLLAIFDALADYRTGVGGAARWCAFLAASAELRDAAEPIAAALAEDTALLGERLLALARPIAGDRAPELADAVLLAYTGTLAGFLRGSPKDPVAVGRRVAAAAIAAAEPLSPRA